jgi:hypothetical protein
VNSRVRTPMPSSPSRSRFTTAFFFAMACLGVLGLAAAVYFVWSGVTWYKLGALVACSALTLVCAVFGSKRVGRRG